MEEMISAGFLSSVIPTGARVLVNRQHGTSCAFLGGVGTLGGGVGEALCVLLEGSDILGW